MSWDVKKYGFATRAIHAGQQPDPTTGAIMPPIYMTSTFVQSSPGQHKGYDYSRAANPTRDVLGACLASIESGKYGHIFASGCAATTTVMHMLKSGDHVIAGDDMYGGSFRLFDKVIRHFGIEFSYVDLTRPESFSEAIRKNTRLVWMETPTNPTLKLVDIATISRLAREKNILSVVDNTFMSPYFQRPLELGADMVMHSTTKFINGHSDIIGGCIVTSRDDLNEQLAFLNKSLGGIGTPFDAYIILRSVKTLAVRMQAHAANARAVAEFLSSHPKVERVIYPGLKTHPQYALAQKQMHGMGGMISFCIKGGLTAARALLENVKVFSLAESLGGVESLIEHPAIMTHASVPADQRQRLGIDDGLIRLSVGIEDQKDLLTDLEQALERVRL